MGKNSVRSTNGTWFAFSEKALLDQLHGRQQIFRIGLLVDKLRADLVTCAPDNPTFAATVRQNESESVGNSATRSQNPNAPNGQVGYQAIARWRLAPSLNLGCPT